MGKFTVDNSRWPLSVQHMPDTFTDEEVEAMLEVVLEEVLGRDAPYGAVLELRRLNGMSAVQRRRFAQGLAALGPKTRHCRALAVVSDSMLTRGIHTALRWVISPPHPERVFESRTEAEAWVIDILEREGLWRE